MASGFTIVRVDELDREFGKWVLLRRALELRSFGMNLVEIPPGEDIPAHDETGRAQEEVFIFLSGNASMVVEGERHPAPAGTYARFDPGTNRQVVNDGDETAAVLIVSAPTSSGYEPMEWA
ncbi:MAG TPA: cupin domain-containing protein [Gaiellaceae bacterium]|jgi:quercetin dioxygenase-like cupin family protein